MEGPIGSALHPERKIDLPIEQTSPGLARRQAMTRAAVVSAVTAPGDRTHALSWLTSQPSSSVGRSANGQYSSSLSRRP